MVDDHVVLAPHRRGVGGRSGRLWRDVGMVEVRKPIQPSSKVFVSHGVVCGYCDEREKREEKGNENRKGGRGQVAECR